MSLLAFIILIIVLFVGYGLGFKRGRRKASRDISESLSKHLDSIEEAARNTKEATKSLREGSSQILFASKRLQNSLCALALRSITIEFLTGLISEESYWEFIHNIFVPGILSESVVNKVFDGMENGLDASLFKHGIDELRKKVLAKVRETK